MTCVPGCEKLEIVASPAYILRYWDVKKSLQKASEYEIKGHCKPYIGLVNFIPLVSRLSLFLTISQYIRVYFWSLEKMANNKHSYQYQSLVPPTILQYLNFVTCFCKKKILSFEIIVECWKENVGFLGLFHTYPTKKISKWKISEKHDKV